MEIEASVHFQQKILMAAVTGIEFLNKKFDPIGEFKRIRPIPGADESE